MHSRCKPLINRYAAATSAVVDNLLVDVWIDVCLDDDDDDDDALTSLA
jgi:hypothetical protein